MAAAAAAAAAASSSAEGQRLHLIKDIKTHGVAIAELENLPSSRTVYQRTGNIFFRTTIQKATAAEQKQLDSAKAALEKFNSH